MKITKLPIYRDDKSYMFEPYTGLLLERKSNTKLDFKTNLDTKVSFALKLNDKPYTLEKPRKHETTLINTSKIRYQLYAKLLIRTCKVSFLFTRILTIFRFPFFENSTEAIIAFRKIAPVSIQNDLCLPRALFAAVTSKKFKEKGVVFIGVFLPSKSMHAWVIEDGVQPDPYDDLWVNFQPVAAIW
jgi:hypothetical protein